MATIKATMPGVVYRRPAPEAAPYVEEGGTVASGQTVALIEVMKNFNELSSEREGTLTRFLVEDGDEVSIGQEIAEVDG
ncbi:acetyl-CoA carboxylase biotin carboxyl carrier protein [Haloactinospora alba]|uniref:Biotin carboxyl carrier protein of acetyl-CoA carboxylase n=1 Tax=Haloactinospora alba TaxID=405555 RepID=A0A543N9H6_9ACTN|nr:acetyl-CoA carboxylase [Haloactinospora alba]TQN28461.1 acetyl-CoA carboxylase biotin carboxyl carrier protein [Haloactinospora alba]